MRVVDDYTLQCVFVSCVENAVKGRTGRSLLLHCRACVRCVMIFQEALFLYPSSNNFGPPRAASCLLFSLLVFLVRFFVFLVFSVLHPDETGGGGKKRVRSKFGYVHRS